MPARNLLVSPGGAWRGAYTPALLRIYPFALAKAPAPADEEAPPALDVHEDALTDAAEGEPLYDEQGEPVPEVLRVQRFAREFTANRQRTRRAVGRLQAAGLIAPWPLKLRRGDEVLPFEGISRIDEARLKALAPEPLAELCANGALGLAYAQLLSQSRLRALQQAAAAQARADDQRQALDERLQEVLDQDGSLQFDF